MSVVLAVLLSLGLAIAGEASDFNKSDAIAAWNRLEELYLHTRLVFSETGTENAEAPHVDYLTVDSNGENFLVQKGRSICGGNADYSFRVQSQGNSWKVRVLEGPRGLHDGRHVLAGMARMPFSVADVPLKDVVSDPTFQVTSSTPGEFSFKINSTNDKVFRLNQLDHGIVRYDPANYAVKSFEVNLHEPTGKPTTNRYTAAAIEYGEPSSDFLNLKRAQAGADLKTEKGRRQATWEAKFTECSKSNLQPAATRLSAFGLPEPGKIEESGSLPWALINLGVALLAVVLFLLWRNRKARQSLLVSG